MTRSALNGIGRSLLLLLAAVTLLAAGDAAPKPFRPPAAGKGDVVAELVWVKGRAKVTAAGKPFDAAEGFQLLRSDVLDVPPGGLLAAKLVNGYVVRVDEDLTLPVSELLLLDATPATETLSQQVDRLFSPAEKQEAGQRLAGYQARAAAATSVGAVPAEAENAAASPSPASPPAMKADKAVAAASPPPTLQAARLKEERAPAAEQKKAMDEDGGALRSTGVGSGAGPAGAGKGASLGTLGQASGGGAGANLGMGGERRKRADAQPVAWRLRTTKTEKPGTAALPRPLLAALRTGTLRQCIVSHYPQLAEKEAATLLLRVRAGVVTRATVGGSPMPECLAQLQLVGRRLAAEDGWALVPVRLR